VEERSRESVAVAALGWRVGLRGVCSDLLRLEFVRLKVVDRQDGREIDDGLSLFRGERL